MNIPTPKELREKLPKSLENERFISKSRELAKQRLLGEPNRLVIIVGPCSLHEFASSLEYGRRFKELSKKVEKSCFLVMRAYVEKPRTITGWKGMLYDPFLDGKGNIQKGLEWARGLLLELTSMEIPIAAEFVDPLAALYFEDLVTWGFIGARTSASQPHRQFASSLSMPVGFKNAMDGSIEPAIQGVLAARAPHLFLGVDLEGRLCSTTSRGNPFCHTVLRGSLDKENYAPEAIAASIEKIEEYGLFPKLMVDCAHGNCRKNPERQKEVFYSLIEQIHAGNENIFGMMLESHLHAGTQALNGQLKQGVSITDPCLDWESTEELICFAAASLTPVL